MADGGGGSSMMALNESQSFYDVLEISPDATQHDIRAAYLRLKAAYSRDSVALYSLFSKEETHAMLEKIEIAYRALSNPEKRREYDRDYSRGDPRLNDVPLDKVISIDRVPPMSMDDASDDALVPPSTDFSPEEPAAAPLAHAIPESEQWLEREWSGPIPGSRLSTLQASPEETNLQREIEVETEWTGAFIRKVREVRGVSLEELAEHTKISKSYITAIEEENHPKLPAKVFLRGFLAQIAKKLRLPQEPLVNAYLSRYKK